MTVKPLILASKSAARAAMLAAAGIHVKLFPADIDERALETEADLTDPLAIARRLAEAKALAVSRQHPGHVVLGADQTCALGARRFTKAPDDAALRDQLRLLRANTHHLHSAGALARDGAILATESDSAALTMRAFSDAFLDTYIARNGAKLRGSVGGYQLEGEGVQLFERIEGDYFTILGLPFLKILAALRAEGIVQE